MYTEADFRAAVRAEQARTAARHARSLQHAHEFARKLRERPPEQALTPPEPRVWLGFPAPPERCW